MPYFLCLDLGSSGAKAAVLKQDGSILGMAFEEYRFSTPQPFYSEIDPTIVWEKTCHAIKNCRSQSGVDAKDIVGIGISMIGETIMALDENGDPAYPAIESMDARDSGYKEIIDFWKNRVGAEHIFQITSYPLSSLASANKVLWLKENRPEIFKRIAHFVTFQDYAIYRMTGEFAIDYSMASRTMLFDVKNKVWSDELLNIVGVDRSLFSSPYPAYHVVGELTAQAAQETDLDPGLPVILGAHDQACASLGVGIISEGTVMDGTGSVEAVIVPTSNPIVDPDMLSVGHGSQCYITKDVYLGIGFHLTAGLLVRWYRDHFAFEEQLIAQQRNADVYDVITEHAQKSPPGSNGVMVLPHFRGAGSGRVPPLNPLSKGTIVGLTLANTRYDVSRAIFEGITLETRLILSSMERSGIKINQIRVTGGGAKSKFWLQLKADITGKTVVVPTVTEASLLGSALLIGLGLGIYHNLQDATEQTVSLASQYEPDKNKTRIYDRLFPIYQSIYPSVERINSDLSKCLEEIK